MSTERKCLAIILKNPFRFVWRVVLRFHANKGLILSGAIAYNTLLSIIPVFTLLLIVLSHLVDEQKLLFYLGENLQLVVPGLTETLLRHAEEFLLHRRVAGWISIAVMLFFSSIAFMVLENTMEVIFCTVHSFIKLPRRAATTHGQFDQVTIPGLPSLVVTVRPGHYN